MVTILKLPGAVQKSDGRSERRPKGAVLLYPGSGERVAAVARVPGAVPHRLRGAALAADAVGTPAGRQRRPAQ